MADNTTNPTATAATVPLNSVGTVPVTGQPNPYAAAPAPTGAAPLPAPVRSKTQRRIVAGVLALAAVIVAAGIFGAGLFFGLLANNGLTIQQGGGPGQTSQVGPGYGGGFGGGTQGGQGSDDSDSSSPS